MTHPDLKTASLSSSEHSRSFLVGSRRSVVRVDAAARGMGTFLPGWWGSRHAGAQSGKPSERHVGYVLSGHFVIEDSSGCQQTVGPGEAFEVGPRHDAWVVGDTPCVALDFTSI